MKYKKDDDNRYRVRFMRATEEMMDTMTVKEFITYLENNAEFVDNDTMYVGTCHEGHIIDTKVYMLREAHDLRKEFIVTEDGRVFYWLSVIQKIELVDDEIPEGMVEGLQAGDTYRNFGCIWLVDAVYTVEDPELWYKVRIKSHVIKKSPTYKGDGVMDCGYRERA